ncbi:MAG: T9SS type A sorting domain-containing protein [bacterium]|nr:T9SS type A sorting domain-containing protein [bacterium]
MIVSPTVSTCYTLTGANTFSCSSKSIVCVQVNPLPTITAIYSPTAICAGEEVLLSAAGAFSYQWNGFAPGNPVKAHPLNTIVYSVVGTDASGCTNSATLNLTVNPCTRIQELIGNWNSFDIYPNPSNGEFACTSRNGKTFTLMILDLQGRIILEHKSGSAELKIDLNQFPGGIYFAKMAQGNTVEVIKVLKH